MTREMFPFVVSLLLVITFGCSAASFPISRSVGVGPRLTLVDSPSCPALPTPGTCQRLVRIHSDHTVNGPIEYRFHPPTVIIKNNLTRTPTHLIVSAS